MSDAAKYARTLGAMVLALVFLPAAWAGFTGLPAGADSGCFRDGDRQARATAVYALSSAAIAGSGQQVTDVIPSAGSSGSGAYYRRAGMTFHDANYVRVERGEVVEVSTRAYGNAVIGEGALGYCAITPDASTFQWSPVGVASDSRYWLLDGEVYGASYAEDADDQNFPPLEWDWPITLEWSDGLASVSGTGYVWYQRGVGIVAIIVALGMAAMAVREWNTS